MNSRHSEFTVKCICGGVQAGSLRSLGTRLTARLITPPPTPKTESSYNTDSHARQAPDAYTAFYIKIILELVFSYTVSFEPSMVINSLCVASRPGL